ncbi:hypothetical protein ACFYVL_01230 [Streptomyces sp. NPDC004111]|uniref:hypothetical protein n=1 Tax=Streptomyces sp. NPDC004111 TaxID=3364690 RepID=UPI0036CAC4C3
MTSGRGALTALHLFLVWALMMVAMPVFGFGLLTSGWAGGTGMTVLLALLGVPLLVGTLSTTGVAVQTVVPMCGSAGRRMGWAVLVFILGTLGVLAGLAAYSKGVDLGSAGVRIALTGMPYAVAAALFVPGPWVRLGALAVVAAAVAYGGYIGPAQERQRQNAAEVARYWEKKELLYLGAAPSGMQVSHAEVGPASFSVDYVPVRAGYETGWVGLVVRPVDAEWSAFACPEPAERSVTCTVDAHGEMRTVRDLSGGVRGVTLSRRHRSTEIEVTSQTLGEPGLRRLLNTLHPLTEAELENLMSQQKISQRL